MMKNELLKIINTRMGRVELKLDGLEVDTVSEFISKSTEEELASLGYSLLFIMPTSSKKEIISLFKKNTSVNRMTSKDKMVGMKLLNALRSNNLTRAKSLIV